MHEGWHYVQYLAEFTFHYVKGAGSSLRTHQVMRRHGEKNIIRLLFVLCPLAGRSVDSKFRRGFGQNKESSLGTLRMVFFDWIIGRYLAWTVSIASWTIWRERAGVMSSTKRKKRTRIEFGWCFHVLYILRSRNDIKYAINHWTIKRRREFKR